MIERNRVIEKLRNTTLFQTLHGDMEALGALADVLEFQEERAGATLVAEGQIGDKMYMIFSGTVRIVKHTFSGEDYTVVTLSDHEHVFFGEMALFGSEQRSATVMAETDCSLVTLTRSAFDEFCNRFPSYGIEIFRSLAKIMAGRLRKANQDVITLFEALIHEIEAGVDATD